MRHRWLPAWACALVLGACSPAAPPQPAPGDAPPARRIITLSPHLAELVFAAGAGDRLVGVVEFSDYPPAARQLPRVGDAFRVDYEAVTALKPDLLLAWTSGNAPETLARLRQLGLRVVALEPADLADIAGQLVTIGALAGTRALAEAAAAGFRARLAALAGHAARGPPLSVFLQLSEQPYYTVTDRHFAGQGLRLCGGDNVFGALPGLTAIVSVESILDAAPQVIIATDMHAAGPGPLAGWRAWPALPAVRAGNLFLVDADLLARPGPRLLDGIEAICTRLDEARARLRPGG
ncbi:MAG: cobalamin-binding protein [Gammaproteobacteria bacterium]